MRHLHSDELIDLAEGTRPVSSAPHLQECEVCRSQLADLRTVLAVTRDVEVPEPSPLYWNHFSARVREAVAAEGVPRRLGWLESWSLWASSRTGAPSWAVSAGAVAVLVLIAALTVGRFGHVPNGPGGSLDPSGVAANADVSTDTTPLSTDASLDLVADLAQDLDWNSASEDGFAPRQDAVERAVGELNDIERRELRRLLREELAKSN